MAEKQRRAICTAQKYVLPRRGKTRRPGRCTNSCSQHGNRPAAAHLSETTGRCRKSEQGDVKGRHGLLGKLPRDPQPRRQTRDAPAEERGSLAPPRYLERSVLRQGSGGGPVGRLAYPDHHALNRDGRHTNARRLNRNSA
eukprot:1377532-Pleurochrysis_carterae.AAC.5